ncbi:MAG: 4'-phosphopantetheinyl transferase family protein [Microvirga sp.]
MSASHNQGALPTNREAGTGPEPACSRPTAPDASIFEPQIHLYVGLCDEVDTPAMRDACRALLSDDEKARIARLASERQQREFLLARGVLRLGLSRIAPAIDPSAWRFEADRHGRPFIAAPSMARPLHFSLSHTDGCVACAISGCETIGVDVEATDRLRSPLAVAEHAFSKAEIAELARLPAEEQADRFFDYWTLKEAYVKARGIGLLLPLDQFSMLIRQDGSIGIAFAPGFADDALRWSFTKDSPSPHHRLAVADGSGLPGGSPIVRQPWPMP